MFAGNDKPGVMLAGAVRRFVNMYAVRPGSTAVVFTANEEGDAAAADLDRAGAEVTVVDARTGENIVRAYGGAKGVRGVELAGGARLECDLLVTATGWTAPTSLLNMAGDRPVYDEAAARFFPSAPIGNVLATGGLAGDSDHYQLVEHARATGRLAAARAWVVGHRLQAATTRALPVDGEEPSWPEDTRPALPRRPHPATFFGFAASAPSRRRLRPPRRRHPALFRSNTHGMVDYSEDVTSKDMVDAAAEGYDSVELLKRYTTATMGPSQGKLETVNTVAVLAEARGETISQVGTTVWRPPYAPITLGALRAAGSSRCGCRRSSPGTKPTAPRSCWPASGSAPTTTATPAGEVLNTDRTLALWTSTPLGKHDLRGPDVPKLLNHLYTNKWMKLAVGSVRYGVMCAEDGVVLDDGITARLGDQHYLMTTTSAGAATVWEWARTGCRRNIPSGRCTSPRSPADSPVSTWPAPGRAR